MLYNIYIFKWLRILRQGANASIIESMSSLGTQGTGSFSQAAMSKHPRSANAKAPACIPCDLRTAYLNFSLSRATLLDKGYNLDCEKNPRRRSS